MELRAWIQNHTTLKVLKVLKYYRLRGINSVILNPFISDKEINIALGRCKGHDDIIDFFEETAATNADLTETLQDYINQRNIKL